MQAGRLSCSDHPVDWSRWPGKGCRRWSVSVVKFVPSDNASSWHKENGSLLENCQLVPSVCVSVLTGQGGVSVPIYPWR